MRFMVIVKATRRLKPARCRRKLLRGHGEVQRGTGQGRRHAGRRGPAAELEGRACAVLRQQAHVIDGPFAETKELIAGYWMWQVKSQG